MVSDFLFWTATAGLGPLMSRLAEAELGASASNSLIARMLLVFTLGALAGRALAGSWSVRPKIPLNMAVFVTGLGVVCYFHPSPGFWLVGQALQGFALGLYAVSMFRLTATLIPAGQRMRGFALIGIADFLGFAFGPVISGLFYGWYEFRGTFILFLLIAGFAFIATQFLPSWKEDAAQKDAEKKPLKRKLYKQFLPLHLCLLLCLLFHIFYSRYLPIMYHTGEIAIESWFFFGYILGGISIRLGIIQKLEKLSDRRVFFLSIVFMCITAVLVGFFPMIDDSLNYAAVFTGVFYGLGFEALYIFCLTYIASNAPEASRGGVLAFVFMGFDVSNLFAGLTFGPLANYLSPQGLLLALFGVIPILLVLPIFLRQRNSSQG